MSIIISRTPLRISLFGGGTDYPDWYQENPGQVISVTINKYSFITVRYLPPFFEYSHRIRYFKNETVKKISDIRHPSVRETLKFLKIKKGIEIVHNADLPARSGLGSSSTFTVGLLNSLYALESYTCSKRELASKSIFIEQKLIKENVGSQDQVAAAFGGLNKITFSKNKQFEVSPIILQKKRLKKLENNLLLFFTGFARNASEIAKYQIKSINKRHAELKQINSIADRGYQVLNSRTNLDEIGYLLNEQWQIKKNLTKKITSDKIDKMYKAGISAGAVGGKLLGAGGGGFMLFYVPKSKQKRVIEAMRKKLFVPFNFDFTGSQIIYHSHLGE